jgi:hypothetical protein
MCSPALVETRPTTEVASGSCSVSPATVRLLQSMEADSSWARRLMKKYGIVQPMAPEEAPPAGCSMATKAGMQSGG